MTSTATVRTAFLGPDESGRGSRIRVTANGRQRTYPRDFTRGGPLSADDMHRAAVERFAVDVLNISAPVATVAGSRRDARRWSRPGYVFAVSEGVGPETLARMLEPSVGTEDARRIAETMTADGPVSRDIAETIAREYALGAASAELDD